MKILDLAQALQARFFVDVDVHLGGSKAADAISHCMGPVKWKKEV